jgi:hypothetical protein
MRGKSNVNQKECRKSLGCALYIGARYLPENTVIGKWRKLHYDDELHDLYCSPTIVRVMKTRMRRAGHVVRMGVRRIQGFGGKPEGKRPLGRSRSRWEDNIKMDLQDVGCGVWTRLSWLRIVTGGGHL